MILKRKSGANALIGSLATAAAFVSPLVGATALLLGSTALTSAYAQDFTSGQLIGTVTDTTGQPVSGLTVTLTNDATGFRATSTTDSAGNYNLALRRDKWNPSFHVGRDWLRSVGKNDDGGTDDGYEGCFGAGARGYAAVAAG